MQGCKEAIGMNEACACLEIWGASEEARRALEGWPGNQGVAENVVSAENLHDHPLRK